MYFSFESKKLAKETFPLINFHKTIICLSVLSLTADNIPTKKFPKSIEEKQTKVKKKKSKTKEDEATSDKKINFNNNIENHLHDTGQKGATY